MCSRSLNDNDHSSAWWFTIRAIKCDPIILDLSRGHIWIVDRFELPSCQNVQQPFTELPTEDAIDHKIESRIGGYDEIADMKEIIIRPTTAVLRIGEDEVENLVEVRWSLADDEDDDDDDDDECDVLFRVCVTIPIAGSLCRTTSGGVQLGKSEALGEPDEFAYEAAVHVEKDRQGSEEYEQTIKQILVYYVVDEVGFQPRLLPSGGGCVGVAVENVNDAIFPESRNAVQDDRD